ncbi:hypothetical protein ACVU7I_19470 [Patulibacter sp. S7RM1-6]
MSPSSDPASAAPPTDDDVELLDGEVVALPAEVPSVDATSDAVIAPVGRPAAVVAAQTAAVVTTGFVAGAIATAVVGRKVSVRRRRRLPRVVGSRRFLVDVHLLGD